MRILVAVDESNNSSRAVKYVGSLLHNTPDIAVTLFHVCKKPGVEGTKPLLSDGMGCPASNVSSGAA